MTAALLPALAGARELATSTRAPDVKPFELDEMTIADLQAGMSSGKFTARSITEKYLTRIDAIDKQGPAINSVLELNSDALTMADAADKERRDKGARGPLHGIPVLIKDNIDTADRMETTAGSLAMLGSRCTKDAFVVQKLREAGAVILGKTNLSEWANIRSSHSSSGWSGRGGQTKNPYALDRNPCGSSSGSGAATGANLCAAAVGTETDGSVVCPSSANGLVGIKPTLGLISRSGVIPIAHSQDTPGPMARTVRDAAILLGALAGVDLRDSVTAAANGKIATDYTRFLDPNGLKGARIGVARKYFGFSDAVDSLMNDLTAEMKRAGAIIVDPAGLTGARIGVARKYSGCSDAVAALMTPLPDEMKRAGAMIVDPADLDSHGKFDDTELLVLLYELKTDLNAYLAARPGAPKTLKDLIDFNDHNKDKEMPYFGQDLFIKAEGKGPLTEKQYVTALEANRRLSRKEGIDALMDKFHLDAIMAPTGSPAWITDWVDGDHAGGGSSNAAAVAGYPDITVPAGFIFGLPVGLSFFGRAWSEPVLLKIAYGFEQLTKARKPPQFLPSAKV